MADIAFLHRLTAEISARMIRATAESLDADIAQSIQDVVSAVGVDRGGLLAIDPDNTWMRVAYAWYDTGIPRIDEQINLKLFFPWASQRLIEEGCVVAIESLADLPPEADHDRRFLQAIGTKSTLNLPLFIDSQVRYIMTVGCLTAERVWQKDFILQLQLIGDVFVSALQRREAEMTLRQVMARVELAATFANLGLWELDMDSGIFWVTEQAREQFAFSAEQSITVSCLLDRVHPDDRKEILRKLEVARFSTEDVCVEYRMLSSSGDVRWMCSRGRAQMPSSGRSRKLLGVTFEVTERKQLESRLVTQVREISDLKMQLEQENTYLRQEVRSHASQREVFGSGPRMTAVMTQIAQVARTGSTVLLLGETGTGKGLMAETIHNLSDRSSRVMINVDCAAIPATLVENELFGREKGAYTGALTRQIGRFELAHGSTLFLDEIDEMPLDAQAKLLRVLQDGAFERLGSSSTVTVDVRIIAASRRDLARAVDEGRFRGDLYYRLNVFPIEIPPLRERREDIPRLAWEFVHEFRGRMKKHVHRITPRDMETLKRYSWPGNVRELRNVIEQSLIVSQGDTLVLRELPASSVPGTPITYEEMERGHIMATLAYTRGRIKGVGGAAERLGLKPSTLYSRMRRLGISRSQLL